MTEEKESRMRTIFSTAAKCVKMVLGLSFAGLMGLVVMIVLIHLYEAHPRLYASMVSLMLICVFVYMTVTFAKKDDNGKEDFA